MLVNTDIKSLELVVAAELANDQVMKHELVNKVDLHDANRLAFRLGEGKPGRLVAKVLSFRTIYGGSGYSFAHDPDFSSVSSSPKYWDRVIQQWYEKYHGISKWHAALLDEVKRNGYITIPSGRHYGFAAEFKHGDWKWPHTQIKNYPVQGFGADLVMLARIAAHRLLTEGGVLHQMVGTIHDSIVVDTPERHVQVVAQCLKKAVESVPELCIKHFNYKFSLPLTCELQVGRNKLDMKDLVLT